MTYKLEFPSHADRWLRERHDSTLDELPFDIDDDGFLHNPLDGNSISANLLRRPGDVKADTAVIILGEPGSGKSTVFRSLKSRPSVDVGSWISIVGTEIVDRVDYQDRIGQHIDSLPYVADKHAYSPMTIVLDQLDESPFLLRFSAYLRKSLEQRDTSSLNILIGCRTADFPSELASTLDSSLQNCLICDLAPLTRRDAATLVETVGIDSGRFLDQVDERRVGPLASIPLTLQLLAASYRENAETLRQNPRELFEYSALRLSDEHDRSRVMNNISSTAFQRLAVAERIAARVLLSGQRTVWTGEAALVQKSDVTEQSLANGTESIAGESFPVTPRIVSETLATALFSRSNSRVSFIHSSFAAFLCARYLVGRLDRKTSSQQQLSSIFLLAAPDEDSASIPVHLRETAAWLVELAPASMNWLAAADPDGLMAYCAYVSSDDSKAGIVAGLLDRAPEVELVRRGWQPVRWKVWHPRLAEQLSEALNQISTPALGKWDEMSRARLAIDIARDCGASGATGTLLAIANNSEWPYFLRGHAARAAMEADEPGASLSLGGVLSSILVDESATEDILEFVGTLVDLLWPHHIGLAEVFRHAHPIRERHSASLYWWTTTRFPLMAGEGDLDLLGALASEASESGEVDDIGVEVDQYYADEPGQSQSTTTQKIPSDTVTCVIERLLLSPSWHRHLPVIGSLLARRVRSLRDLTIPTAATLIDSSTQREAPSTRQLRLAVVESVLDALLEDDDDFGNLESYRITEAWRSPETSSQQSLLPDDKIVGSRRRIVGQSDLQWVFSRIDECEAEGEFRKATALGFIGARVADLYDRRTFELIYSRRESADWPRYSWFYEGIEIESELAKSLRMSARKTPEVWSGEEEYATFQDANLRAAVEGDSTAFWQLVKNLVFDPKTGRSTFKSVDDIRDLPGTMLWDAEQFSERMTIAAKRYLVSEHDHRTEWLGLALHDYRAHAGVQAIILLSRLNLLSELSDVVWSNWTGAIIDAFAYQATYTNDSVATDIFPLLARTAVPALVKSIRQYIRTSLSRGASPGVGPFRFLIETDAGAEVRAEFLTLADEITTALHRHRVRGKSAKPKELKSVTLSPGWQLPGSVDARNAAVNTWATLVDASFHRTDHRSVDMASAVLTRNVSSKIRKILGPVAARSLLRTGLPQAWEMVDHELHRGNSVFPKEIAHHVSADDLRSLSAAVSEDQLRAVFDWLAGVAPPEAEVYRMGVQAVTSIMAVHEARNLILGALVERGTRDSVVYIRSISEEHSEDLRIRSSLIEARRVAQAKNAISPTPDQIVQTLSGPSRRLVQTAAQLSRVIIEELETVARELPSHANLLWDSERQSRPPGSHPNAPRPVTWRPKPEGSFVMYLQNQLALRLQTDAVIVNREVLVRPTDERDSGERADLLVQASTVHPTLSDLSPTTLTVPIEVKGSWNDEVPTAQQSQLAERYMPHLETDAGVYVVGWFDLALWDSVDDQRKTRAKALGSRDELIEHLVAQSVEIAAELGCHTSPTIISIGRSIKAQR